MDANLDLRFTYRFYDDYAHLNLTSRTRSRRRYRSCGARGAITPLCTLGRSPAIPTADSAS